MKATSARNILNFFTILFFSLCYLKNSLRGVFLRFVTALRQNVWQVASTWLFIKLDGVEYLC